MTIKLRPKIKFIAGMTLPAGSIIHTKGEGTYTVETEGENYDRRYFADAHKYYAVRGSGFMVWPRIGKATYNEEYDITFVEVATQEEAPAPAPLFRVGDTVYTVDFGKGKVTDIIDNKAFSYPVRVKFERASSEDHGFTLDGKFINGGAISRGLFFAPVETNFIHTTRPRDTFQPNDVVFNRISGAVSVVSHDNPLSRETTLYRLGGACGQTFHVDHAVLTKVGTIPTTSKE
jgi:hypothetical protein